MASAGESRPSHPLLALLAVLAGASPLLFLTATEFFAQRDAYERKLLSAPLLERARELASEGATRKAVAVLREAVAIQPEDPELRFTLGVQLSEAGAAAAARAELEEAVRIAPGHARAHNNLGILLERVGRVQEAERHFAQAALNAPRLAVSHENLARLLARRGAWEDAALHLRMAVHLRPKRARAHRALARAFAQLGRPEEAARHRDTARALLRSGRAPNRPEGIPPRSEPKASVDQLDPME